MVPPTHIISTCWTQRWVFAGRGSDIAPLTHDLTVVVVVLSVTRTTSKLTSEHASGQQALRTSPNFSKPPFLSPSVMLHLRLNPLHSVRNHLFLPVHYGGAYPGAALAQASQLASSEPIHARMSTRPHDLPQLIQNTNTIVPAASPHSLYAPTNTTASQKMEGTRSHSLQTQAAGSCAISGSRNRTRTSNAEEATRASRHISTRDSFNERRGDAAGCLFNPRRQLEQGPGLKR